MFCILLLFQAISIILPQKGRTMLGKIIGNAIYYCWKYRRNIAIENLTYSFPEKPIAEIKSIARKSFESIAITFFEFFAFNYIDENKLKKMIDFDEGLRLINNAKTDKEGMLFVSGHFGNWELIAYAVGVFVDFPITIVVKPQANEIIDKKLNKIRTSQGNKIVSMYSAAKTIIAEIRAGNVIALLVDQSATEKFDIFVNFFGRPASTFKVVAELALRYRIPLIMGFAIRQPNGKYKAEITQIDYSDLDFSQENILELTKRHTKHLENTIRQYPEQWAWMHRRWKHSLNKK
jgi:KDO2-lipid IV(A) lauroyltransferase